MSAYRFESAKKRLIGQICQKSLSDCMVKGDNFSEVREAGLRTTAGQKPDELKRTLDKLNTRHK
jgi:hypothetical protein